MSKVEIYDILTRLGTIPAERQENFIVYSQLEQCVDVSQVKYFGSTPRLFGEWSLLGPLTRADFHESRKSKAKARFEQRLDSKQNFLK